MHLAPIHLTQDVFHVKGIVATNITDAFKDAQDEIKVGCILGMNYLEVVEHYYNKGGERDSQIVVHISNAYLHILVYFYNFW